MNEFQKMNNLQHNYDNMEDLYFDPGADSEDELDNDTEDVLDDSNDSEEGRGDE